jgi:large repetitive protein
LQVTPPGGYLNPPSSLIPPTAAIYTPTNGGVDPIQAQVGAPTGVQPTTYYFSFQLTPGTSSNVVNNHIPLDPILSGAIVMTKTTPLVNVVRSDLVPYTITATNTLAATLPGIELTDFIPAGFRYRTGSASLNGAHIEPIVVGRKLTWLNQTFAPSERKTLRMILVVGTGVSEGEYVNQVAARNTSANAQVSNTATAAVRVVPDPTFDCSDIIGKVFDDKNANGYQDQDEPGIANVRIATPRGLLVTSDHDGRFHVACAEIPNEDRGSNFVMKVDERTLPTGYRLTTENPRDVRVTRGKMTKLNFGATVHRVIRLELSGAAFSGDTTELQASYLSEFEKLPEQLQQRPSVLRIAYRRGAESADLAKQRVATVRERIEDLWHKKRRKDEDGNTVPLNPLLIETEMEVAQ